MFCDAIVTTNSGSAMPKSAAIETRGVVHSGVASGRRVLSGQ